MGEIDRSGAVHEVGSPQIDSLDRLTESVHILATETKAMREDVSDITSRVDEIEKRPTKRYETVVGAIITVLVGAVIGVRCKNVRILRR